MCPSIASISDIQGKRDTQNPMFPVNDGPLEINLLSFALKKKEKVALAEKGNT